MLFERNAIGCSFFNVLNVRAISGEIGVDGLSADYERTPAHMKSEASVSTTLGF